MKVYILFLLIISQSIMEGRMKKSQQLAKNLPEKIADNKECSEDEYVEIFKSTVKEEPNRPEIKAYFDAMVELNREKLILLRKKKFFDTTDDGKAARKRIKEEYFPKIAPKYLNDPESYMRGGSKDFRLKDANEQVEALKLLEKDFKFYPQNILELAAGQGRLTKQVNAYYEKKNKDIKIDVLEPYPTQLKYLILKKLSKVRNKFISKSEDFYCNEPKYDYIYGGMITNYVPDKYLPKFFVMLKSCLKDGGYIYFKDHFYPSHAGIVLEGQKFRPIEVLTTMMSLVGLTPIKIEESKIIDEKYKRSIKILAN